MSVFDGDKIAALAALYVKEILPEGFTVGEPSLCTRRHCLCRVAPPPFPSGYASEMVECDACRQRGRGKGGAGGAYWWLWGHSGHRPGPPAPPDASRPGRILGESEDRGQEGRWGWL